MNLFLELEPQNQSIQLPQPHFDVQQVQNNKRKPIIQEGAKIGSSRNRWTASEQLRYVKCLKQNKRIFIQFSSQKKKSVKSNVLLSEIVASRSPAQCHSHHQKMIKKYGSVDAIIINFSPLTVTKQKTKQIVKELPATIKEFIPEFLEISFEQPPKSLDLLEGYYEENDSFSWKSWDIEDCLNLLA